MERASSVSQLSTRASIRYASRRATARDHAARAAHGEREVHRLTAIALVEGRVRVLGTHRPPPSRRRVVVAVSVAGAAWPPRRECDCPGSSKGRPSTGPTPWQQL